MQSLISTRLIMASCTLKLVSLSSWSTTNEISALYDCPNHHSKTSTLLAHVKCAIINLRKFYSSYLNWITKQDGTFSQLAVETANTDLEHSTARINTSVRVSALTYDTVEKLLNKTSQPLPQLNLSNVNGSWTSEPSISPNYLPIEEKTQADQVYRALPFHWVLQTTTSPAVPWWW